MAGMGDWITFGAINGHGCGVMVGGILGRPEPCLGQPSHVGTHWFGYTREGYRIPVCPEHLAAVDDPHPLTAADRADLDARTIQHDLAMAGRPYLRLDAPLWHGPREARPADWAESF